MHKFSGQNLIYQTQLAENIVKTNLVIQRSLWSLLGKIIELQNGQFCSFVKFASNIFNSHGHRIVFPQNIL